MSSELGTGRVAPPGTEQSPPRRPQHRSQANPSGHEQPPGRRQQTMPVRTQRQGAAPNPQRLLLVRGKDPFSASPSAALWLRDPEDLSVAPLSFGGPLG